MNENGNGTRYGLVVAIDGPAGAGKSTVAQHLARRFGLLNLETGAMYRALALKALQRGTTVDDAEEVLELTGHTRIVLEPSDAGNRVLLDGEDVTAELRAPQVTTAASFVSVHGPVREWMVRAQRSLGLASPAGVVMEGRDIGTVVFPDAPVKIFLDASVEARGDRRFAQQPTAAESRDALLNQMRDRDTRDRERVQSPLRPAADAVLLDTTTLSLEQVLQRTEQLVQAHLDSRSSS
jgi:cytidylate kinase